MGEIFSQGKGLAGDFTKSVVVSSVKNAKSVLTKVKGTLSDVGTASGAFAKAFGKTYVKECSKYANTCFSISRAAGAGLEAAYKGAAAGFKEAKSALNFVKEAADAESIVSKNALEHIFMEILMEKDYLPDIINQVLCQKLQYLMLVVQINLEFTRQRLK